MAMNQRVLLKRSTPSKGRVSGSRIIFVIALSALLGTAAADAASVVVYPVGYVGTQHSAAIPSSRIGMDGPSDQDGPIGPDSPVVPGPTGPSEPTGPDGPSVEEGPPGQDGPPA